MNFVEQLIKKINNEHIKRFDGMSKEDIVRLCVKEIAEYNFKKTYDVTEPSSTNERCLRVYQDLISQCQEQTKMNVGHEPILIILDERTNPRKKLTTSLTTFSEAYFYNHFPFNKVRSALSFCQ